MRIAHVLTSLCIGGGERVALMLAAQQARAGHDVSVVSLEEPADGALAAEFAAAGAAVLRVPKRRGFDPTLAVRLGWTFWRRRVDVVHTHNPLPLIYAAAAGHAAGARVVHTKHGPHPDRAHRLWLRRLGGVASSAFVAVSEDTAAFAVRIREVSADKLHVIINATDLSRFRPDADKREAVRQREGMPPDAAVIGTVGRMAAVKNQALLIRAAAPLLSPRCRLVIAGDGPERARTEQLVRELGIDPWVHLLGAVHDVEAVMNAFDVFALSSHVEGLPLVLAEAMATGLPVVATRVGGVPKVVDHGETGVLVAPGDATAFCDALAELLGDSLRRKRMGAAARSHAELRYSDERMARQYMRLYDGERFTP